MRHTNYAEPHSTELHAPWPHPNEHARISLPSRHRAGRRWLLQRRSGRCNNNCCTYGFCQCLMGRLCLLVGSPLRSLCCNSFSSALSFPPFDKCAWLWRQYLHAGYRRPDLHQHNLVCRKCHRERHRGRRQLNNSVLGHFSSFYKYRKRHEYCQQPPQRIGHSPFEGCFRKPRCVWASGRNSVFHCIVHGFLQSVWGYRFLECLCISREF